MRQQTIRALAILGAVLLLQAGCATGEKRPETVRSAVAVKELVKSTRSWDGQPLMAYPQGQPEVTIRRITIPAGARLESHLHPVINAGVLMRGELTVVAGDGKTLLLKAGDAIVELVNKAHYGVNNGKDPAEIVVVYAGAVATPITVVQPE